jgi:Flp pilus assembly protein TadG
MQRTTHRNANRRGAALVEFALVLPVIVMLMLGCLEMGRGIMVQHTLQEAAQAACRVYSVSDADPSAHEAIIAQAMQRAGIAKYSVAYDPASKSQITAALEPVTVTISVDFGEVAWLSTNHLAKKTIAGRCTMPADVE